MGTVGNSVGCGVRLFQLAMTRNSSLGKTYAVAAGVSTELGCQCDSGTEVEENVEQVQSSWDEFVEGQALSEVDENQIEECEQAEYCREHGVVDDRWVSGESFSNHVTDETHDDYREDELERG